LKRPSAYLLGSKPGSVVALDHLIARGWDVRAVATEDDWHGSWLPPPSLGDRCREEGIPIISLGEMARESPVDFVISYMYRRLVTPAVLGLGSCAAVNFHAAPLPEYGGWAFYSLAILEEATEYGCTCHHMSDDFDTGPLLRVERFPIDASRETAVSLEAKTQIRMLELFIDFCVMAESGTELPSDPQDPGRMRYLKKAEFEALKRVSLDADMATIERTSRAFWYPPYECAYFEIDGKRLEIVPALAKEEVARALHVDDLSRLRRAIGMDRRP
jgi:methionyl-tRNA formyltransferase